MMKLLCKLYFIGCMLLCANAVAQNDSINRLEKLSIVTHKNKSKVLGLKEVIVSEKQKHRSSGGLTEMLRYNSPVVFRDYGNGGVSSASFRGTSSTNTQVLWNGIAINAVGNGQTDFNTIAAFTADEISIISGGNSLENGSGAIGGTIRLDNKIEFEKKREGRFFTSLGSFNTYENYIKYKLSDGKLTTKIAITYNTSNNDYPYIDDRYKDEDGNSLKNINGNYHNFGTDINLGYKFNKRSKLYFYSNHYNGDRLFSAGLPNPKSGNEKIQDVTNRNLLHWSYKNKGYSHSVKSAYLTQEYKYFPNKNSLTFNYGKSNQTSIIYSLSKSFSKYLKLYSKFGYDYILGKNDNISSVKRTNFYQVLQLKSELFNGFKTSVSVRNEENSFFKLPTVYSLGFDYKILNQFHLKGNYSTNYRQPTNNELFWPRVGNLSLLPETTKQYEFGGVFKNKNIEVSASYFNIDLKNKILWLPTGSGNIWRPKNVFGVLNKGLEIYTKFHYQLNKIDVFANVNYSYITSINKQTKERIPFVPEQSFNGSLSVAYKNYSLYYQQLSQGKIYTLEGEIDFYSLDALKVSNMGFEMDLFPKKEKKIVIGAKVNNLFNTIYYFTNLRPMPGRNYNININYKF